MIQVWRNVVSFRDHPDNGRGTGGCVVGSVFVSLACGHVRVYAKSKCPSGRGKVRCVECEGTQPRTPGAKEKKK